MRLFQYMNESTASPLKEAEKIVSYLLPSFKITNFKSMLKDLNDKGKQYGLIFKESDLDREDFEDYDPIPYISNGRTDPKTRNIEINIYEDDYDIKRRSE